MKREGTGEGEEKIGHGLLYLMKFHVENMRAKTIAMMPARSEPWFFVNDTVSMKANMIDWRASQNQNKQCKDRYRNNLLINVAARVSILTKKAKAMTKNKL